MTFCLVSSKMSSFIFQRRAYRKLPFCAIFMAPISIKGQTKPESRSICVIDVNPVDLECFLARGQNRARCKKVNLNPMDYVTAEISQC